VADQQGSGAVAVRGAEGESVLLEYAVHRLKGDLFPGLMEFMG
jgi:streptomycin 6-kinase